MKWMKNRNRRVLILLVLMVCLAGCAGGRAEKETAEQADEELIVYCPHPLGLINPIISEFENRTGIDVQVCSGGTGELLTAIENRAECDVFWGGSLTSIKPKQELFEPYTSDNEAMIEEEFKNAEGNLTRFTDMPSVLMVNDNLIEDIPVEGYADLLNPELKGKIAMCDPASSSSAWEHLINILYAMGAGEPEAGWSYVQEFADNLDGTLLGSSTAVYQGVADGRFAVGLTFEEGAVHYVEDGYPVRIVYMEEGVISRPDVVGIVRGTRHRQQAEQFVDFVTGKDVQTIVVSDLGRRSVRTDIGGSEYLPDKESIHILFDDLELANQKKQEWLGHFRELFDKANTEGAE